jgi:D-arabinose 1-dehydrogenase-like Zn-dependent alcohol dehydrogenase
MISARAFAVVGDDDHFLTASQVSLRALQPEDVELRVVACGVCHSDIHQIKGEWKSVRRQRPLVPGHEVIGQVVRAGPQAKVRVGQRVGVGTLVGACLKCDACLRGEESYCAKAVDTYNGVHQATGVR